jgi:hypothetical protein
VASFRTDQLRAVQRAAADSYRYDDWTLDDMPMVIASHARAQGVQLTQAERQAILRAVNPFGRE